MNIALASADETVPKLSISNPAAAKTSAPWLVRSAPERVIRLGANMDETAAPD